MGHTFHFKGQLGLIFETEGNGWESAVQTPTGELSRAERSAGLAASRCGEAEWTISRKLNEAARVLQLPETAGLVPAPVTGPVGRATGGPAAPETPGPEQRHWSRTARHPASGAAGRRNAGRQRRGEGGERQERGAGPAWGRRTALTSPCSVAARPRATQTLKAPDGTHLSLGGKTYWGTTEACSGLERRLPGAPPWGSALGSRRFPLSGSRGPI